MNCVICGKDWWFDHKCSPEAEAKYERELRRLDAIEVEDRSYDDRLEEAELLMVEDEL